MASKTKRLSISLDVAVSDDLEDLAQRLSCPKAQIVRFALRDFLPKYKNAHQTQLSLMLADKNTDTT